MAPPLYNVEYAAHVNFVLFRGQMIPCEVGIASTTNSRDTHLLVTDVSYLPFTVFDHHVNAKVHHGIRWPQRSTYTGIHGKCGARLMHMGELRGAVQAIVGQPPKPGEWANSVAVVGMDQRKFFTHTCKLDAVVDVSGDASYYALKPTKDGFQKAWDDGKPDPHHGFHASDALAACARTVAWNVARPLNVLKTDWTTNKRRNKGIQQRVVEYWDDM